jgi:hypothetical protein
MRKMMRSWLGINELDLESPYMKHHDCTMHGHKMKAMYDEEPVFLVGAEDLIKLQGSAVETKKGCPNNNHYYDFTTVLVPKLQVHDHVALVEASKKRTYICSICEFCGHTVNRPKTEEK